MPIPTTCEGCGTRLKVRDDLAGRKVKCARCGAVVAVADTAVTPEPPPVPVARKRKAATPEEGIRTQPAPRDLPDEPSDEGRPRRRKKKRRRRKSGFEVPPWVWWVGGVAAFFVLAIGLLVLAGIAGMKEEAVAIGLGIVIMLPVSTVVLILSMIISSYISGGIEFGEIHIVIPKALALLLVVNVICLLPFGWLLALPVWVLGFMYLFGLDPWEARVLLIINCGMNIAVRVLVLSALISAAQHGMFRDTDQEPEGPPLTQQQMDDVKAIDALGGTIDEDEDDPAAGFVSVSLAGTRATDADLVRLKDFPNLREVDLSGTAVTDAGLAHLKELSKLQTVNVKGTRVTEAGVVKLRRALPRVKVLR